MSTLCLFIPYWLQVIGILGVSLPSGPEYIQVNFPSSTYVISGNKVIMLGEEAGEVISTTSSGNSIQASVKISPRFRVFLKEGTKAIKVSSFKLNKQKDLSGVVELIPGKETARMLDDQSSVRGFQSYESLWKSL